MPSVTKFASGPIACGRETPRPSARSKPPERGPLQTIRKPRRTARVGTTWKVPKRTRQGQRATWTSKKPPVCEVKKGKRLVFRKRGKCIVSVTAPSTLNLIELRKTFTVRVKGRR